MQNTWRWLGLSVVLFGLLIGCGNSSSNSSVATGGSLGTPTGGSSTGGDTAVTSGGSGASSGGASATTGGLPADGGAVNGGSSATTGGVPVNGGASDGGSTNSSGGSSGGASSGGNGAAPVGGVANRGGSAGASSGGSAGGAAPDPSAEIYDPENLPRFDIDLPQASIDALNMVKNAEDPLQNTYVTATLHYGSETVSNIGVRIKGEGSFQKLDQKPPLKLKFDEFVPKQEFHGLRRLALNNLFEDPSFIAERLAYDVYRAAGVPAPRCNNALVYINGTFYGVYANVEAEDKTFLRRWFPTDGGNLYEEGQKDFVTGAETAFDLETNETANDRTDLKNLIAAIQAATNPDSFLTDIGGLLNTDNYLKFTAVEAAVNQWDMYSYTVFYVNNLRLYDDPTSKKFHFIPWGHDLSMKPFRDSGKPFIKLFELARQGDGANRPISAGLLFQRCLKSPSCKAAYSEQVRAVIQVWEGLDMAAAAKRYYEQVKSHVYLDTRKNVCCKNPPTLTDQAFEAGYQSVLTTIRGRVAALQADLTSG